MSRYSLPPLPPLLPLLPLLSPSLLLFLLFFFYHEFFILSILVSVTIFLDIPITLLLLAGGATTVISGFFNALDPSIGSIALAYFKQTINGGFDSVRIFCNLVWRNFGAIAISVAAGFILATTPVKQSPQDLPSDPRLYKAYLCRVFSIQLADVIDLTAHIKRDRFIAAGGSGEVYKASWIDPLIATSNVLPIVVVKLIRLPPLRDEAGKSKRYKRMKRELELWSKLNHPHILPLIGIACVEDDANLPAFISPWMENGNVMDFLHRNPFFTASRFLKDIIKGLHYLHTFTPVIIHGDIKGANVLINHREEACLSDFGLSRIVLDNTLWRTTATHANGTLRWMAPELIEGDMITLTIATDIYAFGMTCYEILSRGSPFAAANDLAVMKKVTDGQRPAKIESCHSDEIWSIITQCWAHKPEDRPLTEETLKLVLQHDDTPLNL